MSDKKLFIAALAMALLPLSAGAADGSSVSSVTSFKLIRGARAAGMAGAYTALGDDTLSMLYNPAGLTELREVELLASHLEWLDGVRDESLHLGVPVFGLGAWGLGATYLYAEDQGRDNWGTRTNTFNIFDFSMQAAFAVQIGDNASAGLVYKILRQGYEQRFNMGSAFDLGLTYKAFGRSLILGLSSQNMGTNVGLGSGYAPLPWTLKGGLAWRVGKEFALALDYEHQPYDFFNKYRLGGEYKHVIAYESSASIRAGYQLGPENAAGGLSGFSAGLGGQWRAFKLDYAFVPKGDLGLSHMLSLSIGFGQR